ncbi:hypothetical protein HMPREF3034_01082 [Prevotella sp. DNF00663]|nr:hypothetical protein HMPREF3034_01082 [Prevotella sp. DNF00663]
MKYYYLVFELLMFCICINCKPIEDSNHHNHITFGSSDIWSDTLQISQ